MSQALPSQFRNVPCHFARRTDHHQGAVLCSNKKAVAAFGPLPSIGTCMRHCPEYTGPKRLHELTVDLDSIRRSKQPPVRRWYHSWLVPWKAGSIGTCGNVTPVYHWLWQWYGWPYPLRLLRWAYERWRDRWNWAGPRYTVYSGCGCIVRLKQAAITLKQWWRYTYGEV